MTPTIKLLPESEETASERTRREERQEPPAVAVASGRADPAAHQVEARRLRHRVEWLVSLASFPWKDWDWDFKN